MPVLALSEGFRGRIYRLARRALPGVRLPVLSDELHWVTSCKPAVQGADKVLDYLRRYVHRTALSDKAIVGHDDETVTFAYRGSGQSARRTMTLPAGEFLRRFLQHVPPKGFHRVWAFGLLHPSRRSELHRLQLLLRAPARSENRPSRMRCLGCGETALRRGRRLSAEQCVAWESRVEAEAIERARAPP